MTNPAAPPPESIRKESTRKVLEEKLRALDQQLHDGLLARGFDPAQDDNLALTAPLAKLYLERENLRAELETLDGTETRTEIVSDDDRSRKNS